MLLDANSRIIGNHPKTDLAWTWLDGDTTQTAEALGLGDRATRVIEFVPGEPTPLLDLRLRSDRDDLDLGWWTFRVQRTTRAEMEGL